MNMGVNLKNAWKAFDMGASLSDADLDALIEDAKAGERFLSDRGETGGVLFKLRLDLNALQQFKRFRKELRES